MALTKDQIHELKKQLSEQIAHLPHDQREEAQDQIDEMSDEALEAMLSQQTGRSDKNVLRRIIERSLASKEIDENKSARAVLDIRPVSKGHVLIIPREAVHARDQLPTQAFTLAKKIAKRIKSKLKPKGVEIQTETKFEEQVLNVLPYYEKPVSITSPRYEASQDELEEVQRLIRGRPRKQKTKKKHEKALPSSIASNTIILRRRIP